MRLYPRYQQCLIDCDMAVYQIEDGPTSSAPTVRPHQKSQWRNQSVTRDHDGCYRRRGAATASCELQLLHPCQFVTREFADLMMQDTLFPCSILVPPSGFRELAMGINRQHDAGPWGRAVSRPPAQLHSKPYRGQTLAGRVHGSQCRRRKQKSLST